MTSEPHCPYWVGDTSYWAKIRTRPGKGHWTPHNLIVSSHFLEILLENMKPSDIEAIANCKEPEQVSLDQKVVSWSQNLWRTEGIDARMVQLDWKSVCQQPEEEKVVSQFAFHTKRLR